MNARPATGPRRRPARPVGRPLFLRRRGVVGGRPVRVVCRRIVLFATHRSIALESRGMERWMSLDDLNGLIPLNLIL